MTGPRYIDIHALQTVPYANLNRDDLGAPKTLDYGGAERTRVSSQSWKRAVRHQVEARLGDPALRTRRIVQAIAASLAAQGWDDDLARAGARQVILSAGKNGLKLEPKKDITSVLLYLPARGIGELAAIVASHRDAVITQMGKKEPAPVLPGDRIAEILRSRAASIQLFGRMLAELPGAEVDGAVQFAHAFTTHATSVETDFFTAVDDIESLAGDAGSGHMNAASFSAGTFYRYANLNLTGLLANLDDDHLTARELTAEFLRAFVSTVPAGKQTSTAAMTVPELVYIAVRTDRPISLAPAFEPPILAEHGFSDASSRDLARYAAQLHSYWGTSAITHHAHACLAGKPLDGLGDRAASLDTLLADAVQAAYPETTQP